jgi:hypothetical protein
MLMLMNGVVRAVLVDVAPQRQRPDDPHGLAFPWARTGSPTKSFSAAVARARRVPEAGGEATGQLDAFTEHGGPAHFRLQARHG